jgi:hypothetical protein
MPWVHAPLECDVPWVHAPLIDLSSNKKEFQIYGDLRGEEIVRFVDIGDIVDHHCLNGFCCCFFVWII